MTVAGFGFATRAAACSCIGNTVTMAWPGRGFDDLPTDTTLVFQTSGDTVPLGPLPEALATVIVHSLPNAPPLALDAIPVIPAFDAEGINPWANWKLPAGMPEDLVYLAAPALDGNESGSVTLVALERLLELNNEFACTSGTHFARPMVPLQAGTDYYVMQGYTLLDRFRTGFDVADGEPARAAAAGLAWHAIGLAERPATIHTLLVEGLGHEPLVLHYQGSGAEIAKVVRADPAAPPALQLDLGEVVCPSVEVYAVDATLLLTKTLCVAERCVPTTSVAFSSCGGNPSFGTFDLTSLESESLPCDTTPSTSDLGLTRAVDETVTPGCTVARASRTPVGVWGWLLSAGFVLTRRWHRS
jgi:hypothetical protein